ncbi:MAG: DUF6785 family protein [Hymenobacter sp.]
MCLRFLWASNTGPLLHRSALESDAPLDTDQHFAHRCRHHLSLDERSFVLAVVLFWFIKAQLILAYAAGLLPASLPKAIGHLMGPQSFTLYQQVGGYLAYVALVLWAAREHLGHVARRALGRAEAGAGEKNEALSYPVAFWGFVLSFAFMVLWSMVAGMRIDVALALWVTYLVIAIALTRVVVEGGLLFVQQGWTPLGTFCATGRLRAGNVAGSGEAWCRPLFLQIAMLTDLRAFLMPSFVQSFKLAHDRGIRAKPLLALICAVTLLTLAMSLWMNVKLAL